MISSIPIKMNMPKKEWFKCLCETAHYIIQMAGLSKLTIDDGEKVSVFYAENR